MKILILGHTGFVGLNLIREIKKTNILFKGISKSDGFDIINQKKLTDYLKKYKPDFIINLCANVGSISYLSHIPAEIISSNTLMINSIYESISKSKCKSTIINPIANCAYPGNSKIYEEKMWQNGPIHHSVDSYGSTRRLMYSYSIAYKKQYNISSINLLVPNMYGEFDSTDPNKAHALNALISKFVKLKNNNKEVEIWGTGNPIREWIYAKDFARIIIKIIKSVDLQKNLSNPVNLGQKKGYSIKNLAKMINNEFSNEMKLNYNTSMQDGAPIKLMDNKLFKKIFIDFKFTDIKKGIKSTIRYYKTQFPY